MIENPQTANLKHAIHLTADAIYNTIQYCAIKGSSYNSVQIQKSTDGAEKKLDVTEDDEEWGAVPAFLRRNRNK